MYLLAFLLSLLSSTVFAQTQNPVQYVNDHFYQLSTYQKDYSDYQEKYQIHQKFSAISTENDLINSTKKVFLSRNLALRTYLTVLRINLNSHLDVHPQTSLDLQTQLKNQEKWLNQQKQTIDPATTLDQLQNIGKKFSNTYLQIEKIINNSATQNQINRQTKIYQLLKQLNSDIQQTPTQKISEWFTNIDNQLEQIPQFLQKATSSSYYNAREELQSNQVNLQQVLNNLKTVTVKIYSP